MDWNQICDDTAKYFAEGTFVRGIKDYRDILQLSPEFTVSKAGPIDWSWGLDDRDIDTKVTSSKAAYEQRCNQVELLLHESGVLIDRSLGDLLKYDDLNVERFKVLVEFVEYYYITKQQDIERQDSKYWDGLVNEAKLSAKARLDSYINRDKPVDEDCHVVRRGGGAQTPYDRGVNGFYADATFNHGQASGDNHSNYSEVAASESNAAAHLQYLAEHKGSMTDAESHTSRADYETQARIHQLERQEITRKMIAIKLNEMQRPGGALNYNDRMTEVGQRSLDDFKEVYARLYAIAIGLREFYDIKDPSGDDLGDLGQKNRTRIEGAVKWVRKAVNALSRAKMDEQEGVVRRTITPDAQHKLIDELLNQDGKSFKVMQGDFVGMENVRLRGISATAEGLSGDSWIDIEVMCPPQQLSTANITLPAFQSCLGRVSSSTSLNIRDIVGGRPIINRNPVGDWTVRVSKSRHYGGESLKLLHLDFHVAFKR
jgi:hypothetical protein